MKNGSSRKSALAIIIALLLFFPLGLYWMWTKSNWKKPIKIVITVVYAIYFLFCVIVVATPTDSTEKTKETTTISVSEITSESATTETTSETTTETTTKETTTSATTTAQNTTQKTTTTEKATTTTKKQAPAQNSNSSDGRTVYKTPTGKRYHFDPDCGGKNSSAVSLDDAISMGLTPCQKCAS